MATPRGFNPSSSQQGRRTAQPSWSYDVLRTKSPNQPVQPSPSASQRDHPTSIKASILNKGERYKGGPSAQSSSQTSMNSRESKVPLPDFARGPKSIAAPSEHEKNIARVAAKAKLQESWQKLAKTVESVSGSTKADNTAQAPVAQMMPAGTASSSAQPGPAKGVPSKSTTSSNTPVPAPASNAPNATMPPKASSSLASNPKLQVAQAEWEQRQLKPNLPKEDARRSPSPAASTASTASTASRVTSGSSSSDDSIPAVLPGVRPRSTPLPATSGDAGLKRTISSDSEGSQPLAKRLHTESPQQESDQELLNASGRPIRRTKANAQQRMSVYKYDSNSLEQYNLGAVGASNTESSWNTTRATQKNSDGSSDDDPEYQGVSQSDETASGVDSDGDEDMGLLSGNPGVTASFIIPEVPPSESELDYNVPFVFTTAGTQYPKLELALDGRPYNLYAKPDGGAIPSRGALFPAGYTLSRNIDLPFICPVRDCQKAFIDLKRLSGHFGASHNQCILNDCRDGTLAVLGKYKSASRSASSPAFITSRLAKVPTPEPAPTRNVFSAPKNRILDSDTSSGSQLSALSALTSEVRETPVPLPNLGNRIPDVLEYLHGFLVKGHQHHRRADIDYMTKFVRKRELPTAWRDHHQGSDLDPDSYALIIAYLVGDEVATHDICSHCDSYQTDPTVGRRLSDKCIRLPKGLPSSSFWKDGSCIGCKYTSREQRQRNKCSWLWDKNGNPENGKTTYVNGEVEPRAKYSAKEAVARDRHTPGSGQYRSQPASQQTTPALATAGLPPPTTTGTVVTEEHLAAIRREAAEEALQRMGKLQQNQPKAQAPITQTYSMDNQEMEDWEFSPGIIKDADTNDVLVLSNPYLAHGGNSSKQIYPDLSVGVKVVNRGQVAEWAPEEDKIKTCFIGSGQLTVHIGGQKTKVGPGGAFVLAPGKGCRVENRSYIDAMVMVTEVHDYSLRE